MCMTCGVMALSDSLLPPTCRMNGRPVADGIVADAAVQLIPEQAANLQRFVDKLPSAAGPVSVDALGEDSVMFTATVPARSVPGSYAVYQKLSET